VFFQPGRYWEEFLKYSFEGYVVLKSEVLVGTHLVIFVKEEYLGFFHGSRFFNEDVKAETLSTGLGNVIGNKGAVGISFLFGDRSFLFVNAHLAGFDI
jgi:hypothetical protein